MFDKDTFSYTVHREKRARLMRIFVHYNGEVEVITPYGVPRSILDTFISENSDRVLDEILSLKKSGRMLKQTFFPVDYREHKNRALILAEERVRHFNGFYNFPYKKVRVGNWKRQWGSCSVDGDIGLHYKILFLPPHLRDYLVVHELCHLKELNHGKKFYSFVQRTIPDHAECEDELRRYNVMIRKRDYETPVFVFRKP